MAIMHENAVLKTEVEDLKKTNEVLSQTDCAFTEKGHGGLFAYLQTF
jgi:hypothetical protein